MRSRSSTTVGGVDYSVIVPVFNSENTLEPLWQRLVHTLGKITSRFEIIMVDDGSRDRSWEVICSIADRDNRVQGLQLMRNFGQTSATMAGFKYSRGGMLITIDDDLQNPPEEIPKLIARMTPDVDVVFGTPQIKRHETWRTIASNILNRITSYGFAHDKSLKLTSYRLLRRHVVDPLLELNMPFPAPGPQLMSFTRRVVNVEVEHCTRPHGRTGYTLGKMINLTVAKLLGISTLPLRFLATIGFLGVAFSSLAVIVVLVRYLLGDIAVPGWTTVTLLLLLLSGFNFLAFGILGEYLQHILLSARKLPPYLVRERYSKESEDVYQNHCSGHVASGDEQK